MSLCIDNGLLHTHIGKRLTMQRRRLEDRIALDFFVLLKLLELAQQRFQISESLDIVLAVLDEVGAGVYQELDFRQEARHIARFSVTYQRQLKKLGVVVPEVVARLCGPQVVPVPAQFTLSRCDYACAIRSSSRCGPQVGVLKTVKQKTVKHIKRGLKRCGKTKCN